MLSTLVAFPLDKMVRISWTSWVLVFGSWVEVIRELKRSIEPFRVSGFMDFAEERIPGRRVREVEDRSWPGSENRWARAVRIRRETN